MAIPSGSGTEVLRCGRWQTQTNDTTSFVFNAGNPTAGTETDTVPANHIITVLMISWCETAGNAEIFHLWANCDSKEIMMLQYQDLASTETFVWNTKFVLNGGDFLKTTLESSADVDMFYTYLDQDWSQEFKEK